MENIQHFLDIGYLFVLILPTATIFLIYAYWEKLTYLVKQVSVFIMTTSVLLLTVILLSPIWITLITIGCITSTFFIIRGIGKYKHPHEDCGCWGCDSTGILGLTNLEDGKCLIEIDETLPAYVRKLATRRRELAQENILPSKEAEKKILEYSCTITNAFDYMKT